jgi:diacylglycerol kinase (ATP)
MCDGVLEVVAVYGSWHLGQLTVGLARAVRLGRGRRVVVTCRAALPMQVDGEPFTAAAGEVAVARAGQALVLRRVASAPAAAAARAVEEVLEGAQAGGVITPAQHYALTRDVAARLQQLF